MSKRIDLVDWEGIECAITPTQDNCVFVSSFMWKGAVGAFFCVQLSFDAAWAAVWKEAVGV